MMDRLKSDLAVSKVFDRLEDSVRSDTALFDEVSALSWDWSNTGFEIPSNLEFDQIEDWLLGQAVVRSCARDEVMHA